SPAGTGATVGATDPAATAPAASAYVDPHTYDKVQAIEQWMTTHVHYTTDIPPLPAGADAVDSFLFGTRRGYCEQISTATVVMLRSLGIPAREAVGYVPGPYNPITDLYDIQAKDAHAWVQVWFPGFGWQSFDPTATVPLANPAPGSVLAHSFGHVLGRVPWIPISAVVVVAAVVIWWARRRSRRPSTWAQQVASDVATGGARLGLPRRTDETLSSYAGRLTLAVPDLARDLVAVTELVERSIYGAVEPSAEQIATALSVTRRFRRVPKRGRWRALGGPGGRGSGGAGDAVGDAGGRGQPREWASASSNDAPAASSGR
ncbi:MAG TPA: transglutaminase domain-containing protein, partial [Acidimicrobiales bacterium]